MIGAGVSGLSSGIRLLESDWEVTIWASEFSPNTTSDIAAALWYPFLSAPVEKTDVWGSNTYKVLENLSGLPDTGVTMTRTYEYFRDPQSDPSWKDVVQDFERRTGSLPEDYVECFSFVTPVIEMPLYLGWLRKRYDSLGGSLRQRTIPDFDDLPDTFDVVVNCTGLESGVLLDDGEVYPVRGQIIRVRSSISEMHLDQQIETLTYIVPRSEDVVLGGVAQQGNWNLGLNDEDHDGRASPDQQPVPVASWPGRAGFLERPGDAIFTDRIHGKGKCRQSRGWIGFHRGRSFRCRCECVGYRRLLGGRILEQEDGLALWTGDILSQVPGTWNREFGSTFRAGNGEFLVHGRCMSRYSIS